MTADDATAVRRLPSVDIVRGVIMILMALDHVRIYFSNAQFNAVDPDQTNLLLFLIRWVTHFCAPGFFVIAGMAIFLYLQRSGDKREVARFLLTRGIWLIALELTIIGFAWSFNPGWSWLGVIWSLGVSFLAMAALIYLPSPILLWSSLAVILLHAIPGDAYFDSLDGLPGTSMALLYSGGPIAVPLLGAKAVLYSLLPWMAMMGFGFGLGRILLFPAAGRRAALMKIGLGMVGLFLILRLTNLYGNPAVIFPGNWSGMFSLADDIPGTVINLLNTSKYPASPQFALMTIGPLFLLLASLVRFDERGDLPGWLRPVDRVGRVPMFFYIVHLYLIHGAALLLAAVMGQPASHLFWSGTYPRLRPPDGYGFSEIPVLLFWVAAVAILLFLCKQYEQYRRTRDYWWLRYL